MKPAPELDEPELDPELAVDTPELDALAPDAPPAAAAELALDALLDAPTLAPPAPLLAPLELLDPEAAEVALDPAPEPVGSWPPWLPFELQAAPRAGTQRRKKRRRMLDSYRIRGAAATLAARRQRICASACATSTTSSRASMSSVTSGPLGRRPRRACSRS
jgi:hypothetical protein